MSKKKLAEEQKLLEEAKKAEIEAEKNRIELEHFEKKLAGKRKYRERKNRVNEDTAQSNTTLIIAVVSGLILILASALYFTVFQ